MSRPYIKELPKAYRERFDAEIEANPPVIVWEKDGHGVLVAVEIYDPHADCPNRKQTRKTA
jgi:hypothetical protein